MRAAFQDLSTLDIFAVPRRAPKGNERGEVIEPSVYA